MTIAPRSLRGQLLGSFLAVALIPTIALGGFVAWRALRTARGAALEHSSQVADSVAGRIRGRLRAQLLYLREVQASVRRGELGLPGERRLAQDVALNPVIQTLLVLDERGRVVAVEPPDPKLMGTDLSRLPHVAEAGRRDEPTWSSAWLSPKTGCPIVSLVVPGRPWTLVGRLEFVELGELFARVRSQQRARVTVIDRDGTVLAANDDRYARERVTVGNVPLVRDALAGRSRTEEVAFLGTRQLASAAPVDLAGWVVVASQPVDEAYAPVSRLRAYFLAAFALASLLATAAAILLSRRIQRPIGALAEAARTVAGGHHHLALPRGGLRETDVLASTFDTMVAAIEEREQLQEQLRHAQKLEAIGRLAGGVAHDFNNLLTVIVGFGTDLAAASPPGPPQREAADEILQAAARAARLTHSLLAYSRKQVLNPRPLDLRRTVQDATQLVGRIIGEDVELAVVLPDAAVPVVADSGQLEQVLMNLCVNARDAMPLGGRLTVAVGQETFTDAFARDVGLPAGGSYARIAVSDTGQGMTPEVRARLFEPFFTTKENGKGTGLGLAMAHGIVRQHEGQVHVRSSPGAGTTVTIFLPLRDGQADARPDPVTAPAFQRTAQREMVLLAEDDALVRRVMRSTLERAGYQVLEAPDGAEAIEIFAAHRDAISLCVFDVVMPRLDGREAREHVRRLCPQMPVLLVSGYAADVLGTAGPGEETPDLLGKPMIPQEFLAKVRELIDRAVGARSRSDPACDAARPIH
jgi:signal transduction histidine kinase